MYNLFLIDVGRDKTIVHKMDVITGDCLTPKILSGELPYQVNSLLKLIAEDRPDKIIFDKNGYGYYFYYYFMERVKFAPFDIDSFGLITYEGGR